MPGTPAPEIKSGEFIRITWPNGSELGGFVHISDIGTVTLSFGPERDDLTRWISLGHIGNLYEFVELGSIHVVPNQRSQF